MGEDDKDKLLSKSLADSKYGRVLDELDRQTVLSARAMRFRRRDRDFRAGLRRRRNEPDEACEEILRELGSRAATDVGAADRLVMPQRE